MKSQKEYVTQIDGLMIGIAILFVVLGIMVKYGKMYSLIAGYNTMSSSEKECVNIKAIANVFRNVMFGMAFIIVVGILLSEYTGNPSLQTNALFIAVFTGVPYLIIVSNLKKYKK